MRYLPTLCALVATAGVLPGAWAQAPASGGFSIAQVMGSPFPSSLTAARQGEHIAWTADLRGVRNVFVADGPGFLPRQITHYTFDDGQPIGAVEISPDGATVVYARGSEENALGNTADPDHNVNKPEQEVWAVHDGGTPRRLGEMGCGDEDCADIALSPDGKWAVWPARRQIWIAPTDGSQSARPLVWCAGDNSDPRWSPDGRTIAFVSQRVEHSFIVVYTIGQQYLRYLAPSVDHDFDPRWSPDGRQIIFVRQRHETAPPASLPSLNPLPQWELWVADFTPAQSLAAPDQATPLPAHRFWQSGPGPEDELWDGPLDDTLQVGADHRVLFSSEQNGWNHLYSVSDIPRGNHPNQALELTPGDYEVRKATLSPDGRTVLYNSNEDDTDRRHLWRVPLDGSQKPVAITRGASIEWSPVETGDGQVLICLGSTATSPAMPYRIGVNGDRHMLGRLPSDFPSAQLVTPTPAVFPSSDGFRIHAQLFQPPNAATDKRREPRPTLIFVHGGPMRQMMLGFHPMDYYHNAYAENEYLASLGFNVLSVNYRSGIMYGHAFRKAPGLGRHGGKEYDDLVAAVNYLHTLPQVDPHRIGIWGGSWGGYLTAMALARNSDLFAAGVDFHGVHDFSTTHESGWPPAPRSGPDGPFLYQASPIGSVQQWRSPVLLIQGDDDRNVNFTQMIELVSALRAQKIPFEQMVLPDEIHGFLRWQSWVRAYAAEASFFQRVLQKGEKISTNN